MIKHSKRVKVPILRSKFKFLLQDKSGGKTLYKSFIVPTSQLNMQQKGGFLLIQIVVYHFVL